MKAWRRLLLIAALPANDFVNIAGAIRLFSNSILNLNHSRAQQNNRMRINILVRLAQPQRVTGTSATCLSHHLARSIAFNSIPFALKLNRELINEKCGFQDF